MPDLVGMPYRKAKLICDNAGLVLDYVVFTESYEARNTVLQQIPQRGQMVYSGDRVGVAISRDSYVRWLPAIYQRSDLNGRNFVKELLLPRYKNYSITWTYRNEMRAVSIGLLFRKTIRLAK